MKGLWESQFSGISPFHKGRRMFPITVLQKKRERKPTKEERKERE